jgi:hypothetical protein
MAAPLAEDAAEAITLRMRLDEAMFLTFAVVETNIRTVNVLDTPSRVIDSQEAGTAF